MAGTAITISHAMQLARPETRTRYCTHSLTGEARIMGPRGAGDRLHWAAYRDFDPDTPKARTSIDVVLMRGRRVLTSSKWDALKASIRIMVRRKVREMAEAATASDVTATHGVAAGNRHRQRQEMQATLPPAPRSGVEILAEAVLELLDNRGADYLHIADKAMLEDALRGAGVRNA